jgi:hypothetical protein
MRSLCSTLRPGSVESMRRQESMCGENTMRSQPMRGKESLRQ